MGATRINLSVMLIALVLGLAWLAAPARADELTDLKQQASDWRTHLSDQTVYIINVKKDFTPPPEKYFPPPFRQVRSIQIDGKERHFWIPDRTIYDRFLVQEMQKGEHELLKKWQVARDHDERNRLLIKAALDKLEYRIADIEARKAAPKPDPAATPKYPAASGDPETVEDLIGRMEANIENWTKTTQRKNAEFPNTGFDRMYAGGGELILQNLYIGGRLGLRSLAISYGKDPNRKWHSLYPEGNPKKVKALLAMCGEIDKAVAEAKSGNILATEIEHIRDAYLKIFDKIGPPGIP